MNDGPNINLEREVQSSPEIIELDVVPNNQPIPENVQQKKNDVKKRTKRPKKKEIPALNPNGQLNSDCLMLVFDHLPIIDKVKMERVCKLWREVSLASWARFKTIDLSVNCWGELKDDCINNKIIKSILKRCSKYVTHIHDRSSSTFRYKVESLKYLFPPNLVCLDLTYIKVSVPELRMLTKTCDNIRELILGSTTGGVNDIILSVVFCKYRNLRRFSLTHNSISGECLADLPSDSLEELQLKNMPYLHMPFLNEHLKKLTRLTSLNISGSLTVLPFSFFNFDIECLKDMNNLVILDVSQNLDVVDDQFLLRISNICKKLRTIILSGNNRITDVGLAAITAMLNLTYLKIDNLKRVTDEALSVMPRLEVFICCNCNFGNESLIKLINTSEDIKEIDCSNCRRISSNILTAAIKRVELRNNEKPLKIVLKGAKIDKSILPTNLPLLQLEV